MKKTIIAAVAGLTLFASACSDEAAFKDGAEDLIEDDTKTMANFGFTFDDAKCTEPAKVELGATFTCTAVSDGVTYQFTGEVTSDEAFTLELVGPTG
mgnify:CR=1 FL=1